MDYKLELVAVPVSDVDRAKAFYEQAGFNADHDHKVSDEMRFVQLTPPGSGCSIAIGQGIMTTEPGSVQGLQLVVDDIQAAHDDLSGRGVRGQRRPGLPVGPLRLLHGPGRERLGGPADPAAPLSSRITTSGGARKRSGRPLVPNPDDTYRWRSSSTTCPRAYRSP